MAEGARLQEVLNFLDEISWNPKGKIHPAAFIRLRYHERLPRRNPTASSRC